MSTGKLWTTDDSIMGEPCRSSGAGGDAPHSVCQSSVMDGSEAQVRSSSAAHRCVRGQVSPPHGAGCDWSVAVTAWLGGLGSPPYIGGVIASLCAPHIGAMSVLYWRGWVLPVFAVYLSTPHPPFGLTTPCALFRYADWPMAISPPGGPPRCRWVANAVSRNSPGLVLGSPLKEHGMPMCATRNFR